MSAKTPEFDIVPRQVIKSNSSGNFVDNSGTQVVIRDAFTVPLSCVITTTNNRLKVSLQVDTSALASSIEFGQGGIASDGTIFFKRNGTLIAVLTMHHQNNVGVEEMAIPPTAFAYEDTLPGAGTYTYTVEGQGSSTGAPQTLLVSQCVLQVEEIR